MGRLMYADSTLYTTADDMRLVNATHAYPSAGWTGTQRYQGRRGVKPSPLVAGVGPLQVTAQSTPNWTVKVANGTAMIEATTGSTHGVYIVVETADIASVTVTPADPTNTRLDLVVIRANDPAVSGVVTSGTVEVIAGTPAPTPVAPAQPNNCVLLATLTIVPGDTAVTAARITDSRVYTVPPGGILPVKGDSDMPASPAYVGAHVYRLDWHETWRYGGATPSWRALGSQEQFFSGSATVSGLSTIGTTVVPISAGRIGQWIKIGLTFWSTNTTDPDPQVLCQVDGVSCWGSGVYLYRGSTVQVMGLTWYSGLVVGTASNKTITVQLSGGAAGSWSFNGIVTVG